MVSGSGTHRDAKTREFLGRGGLEVVDGFLAGCCDWRDEASRVLLLIRRLQLNQILAYRENAPHSGHRESSRVVQPAIFQEDAGDGTGDEHPWGLRPCLH